MLRLASGHSCSSSEVTTALISFSLQVILDPCAAIGNLYKELKSRRTLQTLASLQGDPLSMVNESKLNHNKPLHSGQIFRSQILPVVDWMRSAKMIRGDNSGDSSSFAAKLSPWCTGGGKLQKTSSQEHQATGREWRLRFLNLNKACKTTLFFHLQSHFANMGSWKTGSPTSNPPWLNAQSPKSFSVLQWSHGTIGDRNIPQQILETTTPWPNPLLLCVRQVFKLV